MNQYCFISTSLNLGLPRKGKRRKSEQSAPTGLRANELKKALITSWENELAGALITSASEKLNWSLQTDIQTFWLDMHKQISLLFKNVTDISINKGSFFTIKIVQRKGKKWIRSGYRMTKWVESFIEMLSHMKRRIFGFFCQSS